MCLSLNHGQQSAERTFGLYHCLLEGKVMTAIQHAAISCISAIVTVHLSTMYPVSKACKPWLALQSMSCKFGST